jgi:hypothetical protein
VVFQILLYTNKNFPTILRIPKLCLFLYSFTGCWVTNIWVNFSLQINCKTYPGPMLPPGGQIWQLIYPTCLLFQSTLLNLCREIGLLLSFVYLFGQVAHWCCYLAPRWRHFGPASLPPEWHHVLFTSGITNLSLYKHIDIVILIKPVSPVWSRLPQCPCVIW